MPFLIVSAISNILAKFHRWLLRVSLNQDFVGRMIKSNRVEAINVQFRIWQFDLLVEKSWICFSMTIMLLPLIISTCWLSMVYVRLDLYYKVTGSNDINIVNKEDPVSEAAVPTLLSIVSATLIDLRGIYYLVRYVFCLKPNWRPRIKLDSRYGVM